MLLSDWFVISPSSLRDSHFIFAKIFLTVSSPFFHVLINFSATFGMGVNSLSSSISKIGIPILGFRVKNEQGSEL